MAQNSIKYKILAIGGSAGSLNTVLKIVEALPLTGYLSVIIILHRKSDGESILIDLLKMRTQLVVKEVEDKESIYKDTIYIAPADYHLLIENEKMFCLDISDKVHFSRPSIDVCFESVAEIFGKAVIGVLLSGANADGAEGLSFIHKAGGFTIVQNPQSAEVDYMPKQALAQMNPDKILNDEEIIDCLKQLLK